jgi:tRNA threonylcarbamoyladenosine biosynthesis protein TsaE
MKLKSESVEQTFNIAKILGQLVQEGDIICLNGDLGVGKTHFAKGLAAGLGINEHITSPTYTIVNEYEGIKKLYHFDVYRLGEPDEIYDIGYVDYLNGSGVVLIEWADLIEDLLPRARLEIRLVKGNIDLDNNENYREINFQGFGEHYSKIIEEMAEKCTY